MVVVNQSVASHAAPSDHCVDCSEVRFGFEMTHVVT